MTPFSRHCSIEILPLSIQIARNTFSILYICTSLYIYHTLGHVHFLYKIGMIEVS